MFANVNRSREEETNRIPKVLLEPYTMSTSFGPTIIKYALDRFPEAYAANLSSPEDKRKKGPYHCLKSVYDGLGL